MHNIKIAITGAAGLVGSHLAEYLAKKGYSVRAIVHSSERAQSFAKSWAALGIEMKEANVLNADQLSEAFYGAQVIIHAAGIVDPYAPLEKIFAVNVSGTETVLKIAANAGAKQLIFISSLSVITGNDDQYNSNEGAPLRTCGEAYADSKVQAEKIVLSHALRSKIPLTILRPGFIYGPRERAWLPQLIQAITNGKAILIDGGNKETNVIYVENLNYAIEAALLNEKAYGQIYNLTDGQGITKQQLFNTISKELNLPPISKSLPSILVKPIFIIVSRIIPLLPPDKRKKLARFSMAAYRLIGINQGFSIAKAEQDLDYKERIPFAIGMASTLKSFRENTIFSSLQAAGKY